MANSIDKLRQEIDAIDDQLLKLLKQRIELAQQVGSAKEQAAKNTGEQPVYFQPERQAKILTRVKQYAEQQQLAPVQLGIIFNEIISLCLNSESSIKAVYLGPPGTFTQQAAQQYFGTSAVLQPVKSIAEVFREVEAQNSNYGVVPIENSSEGMVSNTMDLLINSSLRIVGEIKIPIHHCLLGHPWVKSLEDIKLVFSHQQSLAQCHIWLTSNLPNLESRIENSNALAAQNTKQTPGAAAIGSSLNAELYGLNLIAKNIEDYPDNTTRFFILGDQSCQPSGADKTSLVMGAKNEPGSLHRLLACFAAEGIDLNLLESRPTKMGDWQYNFFVDFYGHHQDARVARAWANIKKQASFIKLLGSYPCQV